MAEAPQNVSILRGEAFGGGVAGGIAGTLTGALIGGVPEAAAAYQNVTGAVQREQTHQADLMAKYADLQLKSMEIQQGEMQIEQLKTAQAGNVAQARLFSERAVANLGNVEAFKTADRNQAVLGAVQSSMQLDDQSRQAVAQFADVVNDPQTHAQAYQQLKGIADTAGIPVEQLAPGITEEYQGTNSLNAWMAAKDIAASTQKIRESERINANEHKLNMEMNQVRSEQGLEKQYRGFIYDMLLQQQNMQMRLELEKLNTKPPKSWNRSMLESIRPDDVSKLIREQIGVLSDQYDVLDPDEELIGIASQAATEVSGIIDQGWIAHDQNPEVVPITQAQAITMVMEKLVGRMGIDGKIYEEQNPKLKRQRENWIQSYISIKEKEDQTFASLTLSEQEAFGEAAWTDPAVRRDIQLR